MSDKKRRIQQDTQADRMVRQRRATIKARVGCIVHFWVDERDRAHHNQSGLVGVVTKVSPLGSFVVFTPHGKICTSRKQPIYHQWGDYELLAYATLTPSMEKLKREVEEGSFEETKAGKITISQAHTKEYGTMVFGRSQCRCLNGKCGKGCGCHKNGRLCGSKCTCHGSCR